MKGYEGWSFSDKSFAVALSLSIAWHLFWFSLVTIGVTPEKGVHRPGSKIVFLGSVLDDKIFRVLMQSKPDLPQGMSRKLSEFTAPIDIGTRTIERVAPGSVVSLPLGKRSKTTARLIITGAKPSAQHESAFQIEMKPVFDTSIIEGELMGRPLISRPGEPLQPVGMDPAFKDSAVTIDFTVDPSGTVKQAQVSLSSGDPEIDLLWMRYLRGWQFAALGPEKKITDQKGKIRFRFQH